MNSLNFDRKGRDRDRDINQYTYHIISERIDGWMLALNRYPRQMKKKKRPKKGVFYLDLIMYLCTPSCVSISLVRPVMQLNG